MGKVSKALLLGSLVDVALRELLPLDRIKKEQEQHEKQLKVNHTENAASSSSSTGRPSSRAGGLQVLEILKMLSKFTKFATIGYVLDLIRKRKLEWPLLVLLAVIPRFRIPEALGGNPDAKPTTLLSHLVELLSYHRVGMNLPPALPLGNFLKNAVHHTVWRRHLAERDNAQVCGKIYSGIFPFNRDDLSRAATCAIWVSDPELVKQVMQDKENFPSRGDTGFSQLLGEGLLGMETGPKWHKHRRIVSQFLSNKFLREFSKPVEEEIHTFMNLWRKSIREGKSVNAYYDFSMLTLDAIMRIAFGIPSGNEELMQGTPQEENAMAHGLDFALRLIILRTAMPWLKFLPEPISHEKKLDDIRQMSFALADRVYDQALQRVEDKGGIDAIKDSPSNMLEAMLLARDDEGNPAMSRTEMRDELITIRGAGHETTSNTLCWCLFYLQKNPEKLEKLRREVDTKVAGDVPNYDESQDLPYTTQVVYEGLRMRPTVPSFPRVANKDTKLGPYDVPKYSYVFVSQHSMNRDPTLWENPNEFIPERFDKLPTLVMSKPVGIPDGNLYGFLPFGAGPRTCIGQRLAMAEAVQILAAVVKNFNFTMAMKEEDLSAIADVTLGPKESGLWFNVEERVPKSKEGSN